MLYALSEDEWVIQLCDYPNVCINVLFYSSVCVCFVRTQSMENKYVRWLYLLNNLLHCYSSCNTLKVHSLAFSVRFAHNASILQTLLKSRRHRQNIFPEVKEEKWPKYCTFHLFFRFILCARF
jgi:hypothetical protein